MEPNWAGLREQFPAELITKVDKGYGLVDTINHAVVTDRLNKVDPTWQMEITRWVEANGRIEAYKDERGKDRRRFVPDASGFPHLLAVYGWMEVFGVRRYECGEVEHPDTYGDECKKAISDFVKRAAMRFGVGLDLWTKEDLHSVDGDTAARRSDPADAAPDPMVGPSTDREPSGGSTGVPRQGADAGSEGTSGGSRFIGGREANALQKALGGRALEMAQAEYGSEIFQLTDLTFEQARDLIAKKVVV